MHPALDNRLNHWRVCNLGSGIQSPCPLCFLYSLRPLCRLLHEHISGRHAHRAKREGSVDPGMVFACLAAGRGIGNVACGPLSEALVRSKIWMGEAGGAYGSGYGSLVVFTGLTAMLVV